MPPLFGAFIAWLTTTDLPPTMPGHRLYGLFKDYCTRAGKPRPTSVHEILALADAAGLRIERHGRTSIIHTRETS